MSKTWLRGLSPLNTSSNQNSRFYHPLSIGINDRKIITSSIIVIFPYYVVKQDKLLS